MSLFSAVRAGQGKGKKIVALDCPTPNNMKPTSRYHCSAMWPVGLFKHQRWAIMTIELLIIINYAGHGWHVGIMEVDGKSRVTQN